MPHTFLSWLYCQWHNQIEDVRIHQLKQRPLSPIIKCLSRVYIYMTDEVMTDNQGVCSGKYLSGESISNAFLGMPTIINYFERRGWPYSSFCQLISSPLALKASRKLAHTKRWWFPAVSDDWTQSRLFLRAGHIYVTDAIFIIDRRLTEFLWQVGKVEKARGCPVCFSSTSPCLLR